MGATSADTQREIEAIRTDLTAAVTALKQRAIQVGQRAEDQAARVADVRTQTRRVKEHPAALAGVGLAVVGAGGIATARAVIRARRRQRPEERLKRTVRTAAEELGERWERARHGIPLEVRLGGADDNGHGRRVEMERKEPGMIKRMLWAALVATVMAGSGLAARRLSAIVWKAAMDEDPPTAKI